MGKKRHKRCCCHRQPISIIEGIYEMRMSKAQKDELVAALAGFGAQCNVVFGSPEHYPSYVTQAMGAWQTFLDSVTIVG